MYGSATVLVLSLGQGVDGFTLDSSSGEFVLTHPNIKIPPQAKGQIYSVNEGNSKYWDEPTLKCVHKSKTAEQKREGEEEGDRKKEKKKKKQKQEYNLRSPPDMCTASSSPKRVLLTSLDTSAVW
jgi:hypothetical protein